MANRKAFLVGVEQYGDGFAPLPAVVTDISVLGEALKAAGFETELCPTEALANASALDARMRAFCTDGGPDDVRLLYFSGHGILVDGVDWVIPAFATRHDALVSPNQRVSTDLSKSVAASETGLVLFVIDACRDVDDAPVTKGSNGWGDPERIARPGEHRFIRFFGCASQQVCQVISPQGGPVTSLFTKSLAECLVSGDAASLAEILTKVEQRCAALLARDPRLQPQSPRLSHGELSADLQRILGRPVFERIDLAGVRSAWPKFDPDKFHCVVVLSENQAQGTADWGAADMVRDALAGATGERIWKSFHQAGNGLKLVSGKTRSLPGAFAPAAVRLSHFSVADAFASWESLDKAVRMIVEADLAVFDVTDFEPGVMLLLGIRSASRRWLTICSHGAGWQEGQPLELPFSLQDLNINSHTPRRSRAGPDEVVDRFVQRVETGFLQVARQPNYLDLPCYDSLRQLGPFYDASSTIYLGERILFLCSYSDTHFGNWHFVSSRLKRLLSEKTTQSPRIERIIDYGTPQLIQQALYEQIRRTAACVADWSEFKASVFLEIGARLAASEWGAIHIIDDRYLPGKASASRLKQIDRMRRLLETIAYRYRDEESPAFEAMVSLALNRNPNLDANADYNRIHRAVLSIIGEVQAAQPSVVHQLKNEANALHHPEQGRVGAPQVLFHGSRQAKQDSESMARELRIAAWLYMEHRLRVAERQGESADLENYRKLGKSAIDALNDLGDVESMELADYIEDRLKRGR